MSSDVRSPRRVFFFDCRPGARAHELVSQRHVAQRLAGLLDADYLGDLFDGDTRPHDAYVVPNDTIPTLDAARRIGVHGEDDLFGGVVPHPFVATKVISHGRVAPGARVPDGWVDAFPARVLDAVLPGYSAFTPEDARLAGRELLKRGPVRVKAAGNSGGTGQTVVRDTTELDAQLQVFADAIERDGVVLERDLDAVRTFSIGRLRIGGLDACYVGTQETTPNRHGHEVYGGSTLTLYRGGFDELERHTPAGDDQHRAVALARRYHDAALECYAGLFVSRANYDVVVGRDEHGHTQAGVLEQSWRIGGASGAEVEALRALRADPRRRSVRASTVERHGATAADAPAGAIVGYADNDPDAGPILKYTMVHDDGDGA